MSEPSSTESPSELDGITVVVLGNFNPSIFSPAWFRLHDLLGETETREAQVQMIIPPAALFSTEWLSVQVTQERLALSTVMPQEFERLRDTVVGVMTVLDQTPVQAIGINRESHWPAPDRDSYDTFGDLLVPKDPWSDILYLPGTQDVTVRGVRRDSWTGWIEVTVQPSTRVRPFGVYARINDHYWLEKTERQPRSRADFSEEEFQRKPPKASADLIPYLLEILRDDWGSRIESADGIVRVIRGLSGALPSRRR